MQRKTRAPRTAPYSSNAARPIARSVQDPPRSRDFGDMGRKRMEWGAPRYLTTMENRSTEKQKLAAIRHLLEWRRRHTGQLIHAQFLRVWKGSPSSPGLPKDSCAPSLCEKDFRSSLIWKTDMCASSPCEKRLEIAWLGKRDMCFFVVWKGFVTVAICSQSHTT